MYEEISPAEVIERQTGSEPWQVLDVREPWERQIASIDGSIDIPMRDLPGRIDELDRAAGVAVLCHSGIRSAQVAGYLASQGFARVANVTGGIDAWSTEVDPQIPRY